MNLTDPNTPQDLSGFDIGMLVQDWLKQGASENKSVGCTMLDEFPIFKIQEN